MNESLLNEISQLRQQNKHLFLLVNEAIESVVQHHPKSLLWLETLEGIRNSSQNKSVNPEPQGSPVDWKQLRLEATIAAAAALAANPEFISASYAQIAENAVDQADALIAELQKRGVK